jgi:hypothetical protein
VDGTSQGTMEAMVEYEYRVLQLPGAVSRADVRALLTEHAEYGRWELARVRLFSGGGRKVWLRRRIIRVQRTA